MPRAESDANLSPDLLRQACSGEPAALGQLLEQLRPWMRILADARMGSELAARVDPSGIVQQTCLSVFNRIQQFQGHEIAQFMAWVREIHTHNVQEGKPRRGHPHTSPVRRPTEARRSSSMRGAIAWATMWRYRLQQPGTGLSRRSSGRITSVPITT